MATSADSNDGSRVTLAVSIQDGTPPCSSVALRICEGIAAVETDARFARYRTDELRERLIEQSARQLKATDSSLA